MAEERRIELSDREVGYLRSIDLLPADLVDVVGSEPAGRGRRYVVTLTREAAEQLRDELTVRLASAGFDSDYAPTAEGEMLEELIDRFYLKT